MKDSMEKRKNEKQYEREIHWFLLFRFFLYLFLGAIFVLLGFLAYQYLLSNRVKRISGKQSSQNLLGNQQVKGSYDPDWIPKHHLTQSKSQRKEKFAKKNFRFRSFTKKKSKSTKISSDK